MEHKEYLIEQWKIALSDYKLAHSEEQKMIALRTLHRISLTSTALYGYEFADSLLRMCNYGE